MKYKYLFGRISPRLREILDLVEYKIDRAPQFEEKKIYIYDDDYNYLFSQLQNQYKQKANDYILYGDIKIFKKNESEMLWQQNLQKIF